MEDSDDITSWSKDKATMYLWRAESTYLRSRGWIELCGVGCGNSTDDPNKFMVAPGDNYKAEGCRLYGHNEALKIQKEKDGMNV